MKAIWRIELLGELRVQHADRVITRFPTQKTGVLLAFLAYYPKHPHPRDALIEQLWPEIDLDAARSSLRSALYALRQLLERDEGAAARGPAPAAVRSAATAQLPRLLIASRSTVSLHPDAFTTDVADFRAALQSAARTDRPSERAARLSSALAGYRGELLPGYFEPWILQERRFLAEAYLEGLHHLVTALEQEGDLERALEVARQAVSSDPLRDEAHFDLMRLHAAAGQPKAVLRQYQELERLLGQELGEAPSAAARTLAEELRQRADEVACQRAAAAQTRRSPAPATADPRLPDLPSSETPVPPSPHLPPTETRVRTELPGQPSRNALLRSPSFHRNLPIQLTRFIGRARELAQVQALLCTSRLLTLTGAGGCGKTRLALEVAAHLPPEAGEGIWLVELAPLSDPEWVTQAVATVLEISSEAEQPLVQTLVEELKPRHLLLLLDNCEHLLAACAHLVERLLRHCPQVRILATSRERLSLPGEQIYRVPSLLLPDARDLPPLEELQECEAVRLFADRAALSQPGFALTEANAPSVVQSCRQLDGMPLAIELAAARLRVMEVEQLAARLDDRFRLLTGGSRTALPRQQTLQATLEWSYDLLSEAERGLLRGLSVFAGGFTLEAAEAVCGGGGATGAGSVRQSGNVLDRLLGLVEKSLVGYEPQRGEARYRLLETVRQYARERLVESGEEALAQERHAAYFVEWAEQMERELVDAQQADAYQRVEQEHENLRAALEHCRAAPVGGAATHAPPGCPRPLGAPLRLTPPTALRAVPPPRRGEGNAPPSASAAGGHPADVSRGGGHPVGLRLAGALWRFWLLRRYVAEGRSYLAYFLSRPEAAAQTAARAKALCGAGALAEAAHDPGAARMLLEESLAIRRELGDRRGIADVLIFLGSLAKDHLGHGESRPLHEEALAIYQQLGVPQGIADALWGLGVDAWFQYDCPRARALLNEALAINRTLGDRLQEEAILAALGMVAFHEADFGAARLHFEESLTIARAFGERGSVAVSLYFLGKIAFHQGDMASARTLWEECRAIDHETGNKGGAVLGSLAQLEALEGNEATAMALWEQSLTEARALHSPDRIALALLGLADLARRRGDAAAAYSLYGESLGIAIELENPNPRLIALCLDELAGVWVAQGQSERAARLFGAAEALRGSGPVGPDYRSQVYDRSIAAARAALGEERLAAAWAAGREMGQEQAVQEALGRAGPPENV